MVNLQAKIDHSRRPAGSKMFRISTQSSQKISFIISLLISIIVAVNFVDSSPARYERANCQVRAGADASLEWAYEPLTQHVVFVLKTRLNKAEIPPRAGVNRWAGVGFGTVGDNEIRQFNGIRIGAGKRFDTLRIDSNAGRIDANDAKTMNIHSIDADYNETSQTLIAKFSRPTKIDNSSSTFDLRLDDCNSFYVITQLVTREELSSPGVLQRLSKRFNICNIKKKCTIDVRQFNAKKSTPKIAVSKMKDDATAASRPVDVAHSVDVSSTGDPCGYVGIGYTVNWTYNKQSDCVEFVMRHPTKPGKWWSAVGIGDTMADMDIGVIFLEDGVPKKIIDYFSSGYTVPAKDKQQDWILHSSKSKVVEEVFGESPEKQKVSVTYFSRRLTTGDDEKDRTMDSCVLFQLAANAAAYDGNYALRKHDEWPDLYKACDLKRQCATNRHIDHSDVAESVDGAANETLREMKLAAVATSTAYTAVSTVTNITIAHDGANKPDDTTVVSTFTISSQSIPESEDTNLTESPPTTASVASTAENSGSTDAPQSPTILCLAGEFTTVEVTDTTPTSNDKNLMVIMKDVTTVKVSTTTTTPAEITDKPTMSVVSNSSAPSTIDTTVSNELATHSIPSGDRNQTDATDIPATLNATLSDVSVARIVQTTSFSTSTTVSEAKTQTAETTKDPPTSTTTPKKTVIVTTTSSSTKTKPKASKNATAVEAYATGAILGNPKISAIRPQGKSRGKQLAKCDSSTLDLEICAGYMANYLDQVKHWAEKHNERMKDQYGKACQLLNAVPHVPTLCCHIFREKCEGNL